MQASIGRVGDAALAAAVSEAGGLGSLGASYMSLDVLREQVRRMRRLTEAPVVVNLILAFDQVERLEVAVASCRTREARTPVPATGFHR
jgi:NAD(P)H-dependent flavin oxidoreductase YrpB (nitropropane dioxygenase family)